jgi:hypothetical protein
MKCEVSPYVKGELKIKRFSLYGDIQYRHTIFSYAGGSPLETQEWNFFNWSAGVSIPISQSFLYYGIGKT